MLYPLHSSVVQEESRVIAEHGGAPPHRAPPTSESILPIGMVRIRHAVSFELAASTDRSWSSGDPWQYISCLPSERSTSDPFEVSELDQEPQYKGKRPPEQDGEKGCSQGKPPAKKVKKGVCQLHNTAPNGCPYGKDCIFLHRCTSCGAMDEHGRSACPYPPDSPAGPFRGSYDNPAEEVVSRQD